MSEDNTPADPAPGPTSFALQPRPSLLRFLTEHNPFYLISAACMLASCLALTNSLSWTSISRSRLLTLIVTLNVYEAALLAIALFLVTRRQLRRDGRILLLLQAFFLADFSFLNAEIATLDVRTGLAVNACLLVLAAVKIGVVIRVLKPSFTASQFGFVIAQLAVLFGAPIVLRWLDANHGILSERQFYVVWWAVGLLPALYEVLARSRGAGIPACLGSMYSSSRSSDAGLPASEADRNVRPTNLDAHAAPTNAYLVIPFVSLLVHLGILHWVYRVDYVAAHAAPLMLGLTVVLGRLAPTWLVPPKDVLMLRLVMPLAAVMVSWESPIRFDAGLPHAGLVLTPANLAVAGAFVVYVYCFLLPHAWKLLAAGVAMAAVYVFGPSWQQVVATGHAGWDRAVALANRLAPRTAADWGAIGLVASFGFLALGFWMSLRKQPDVPPIGAGGQVGTIPTVPPET